MEKELYYYIATAEGTEYCGFTSYVYIISDVQDLSESLSIPSLQDMIEDLDLFMYDYITGWDDEDEESSGEYSLYIESIEDIDTEFGKTKEEILNTAEMSDLGKLYFISEDENFIEQMNKEYYGE